MAMEKRKMARFRTMARNVRLTTTIALWTCIIASIGLLIASFLVPPLGEISPSVLKGGSLIFGFAALIEVREAYLEGIGVRLTHGNTTVTIQDQNGPDAEVSPMQQPGDDAGADFDQEHEHQNPHYHV